MTALGHQKKGPSRGCVHSIRHLPKKKTVSKNIYHTTETKRKDVTLWHYHKISLMVKKKRIFRRSFSVPASPNECWCIDPGDLLLMQFAKRPGSNHQTTAETTKGPDLKNFKSTQPVKAPHHKHLTRCREQHLMNLTVLGESYFNGWSCLQNARR